MAALAKQFVYALEDATQPLLAMCLNHACRVIFQCSSCCVRASPAWAACLRQLQAAALAGLEAMRAGRPHQRYPPQPQPPPHGPSTHAELDQQPSFGACLSAASGIWTAGQFGGVRLLSRMLETPPVRALLLVASAASAGGGRCC